MDEQKKVYIVTSGDYPEYYTIEAAFSYESDAEDYVIRRNRTAERNKSFRFDVYVLHESRLMEEPDGE